MRRHAALAFLVVALHATSGAAREPTIDPIDFALRRAALELGAGRPEAAVEVLSRIDRNASSELAVLLLCEARLLAGDGATALVDLQSLSTSRDDFVRAQAVAHRVALAVEGVAATREALGFAGTDVAQLEVSGLSEVQAVLRDWARERGGLDREAAGLVDVAAAWLHAQSDDAAAARTSLEAAQRGPGAIPSRLQLGEMALADGEAGVARKRFEELARVSRDASEKAWTEAWARLGVARALAQAGDSTKARQALSEIGSPEPLASFARLLRGQWAYAQGDRAAAQAALAGLPLSNWNPILATEAELLALQLALDAGDFAAAESLGVAVAAELEARERLECGAGPVACDLLLDLPAWHAAATRGTLAKLASKDVLRRVPDPALLSSPAVVSVLDANRPNQARPGCVRLARLYAHESELAVVANERAAWRVVAALHDRLAQAETARDAARARLDERTALLARGLEGLAASRDDLDALGVEAARLAAGMAAHEAAVAALEQAWKKLVRDRLRGLERALVELRRGEIRLEARYPEDRSVRPTEPVAAARARATGERTWIAAAESLQAELAGKFEARIAAVFQQHELASDKAKLRQLEANLASLRLRSDALAAALAKADALERAALAIAEEAVARAQAAHAAATQLAAAQSAAAVDARTARARARTAAYAEAAAWGSASAAFHAALAVAPGDPQRLERLQHATVRLDAFMAQHASSPQADEALYRMGEVALQRAALEYHADLENYVAAGGRPEGAPVPIESYVEALGAYKRLLGEHPESPRAHDADHQVGFVLAEMGSVEASCEHLERFLVAADSTDVRIGRAALRLGDNRLLLGDTPGALVAFRRAAGAPDPEARDLGLFKAGWCAYDLDRHGEARDFLSALLLRADHAAGEAGSDSLSTVGRATELAPEALELLALTLAADHDAHATASQLDAWGRPGWDFALLRRMAQLFASRAQYDQAIETDELLLERHASHPELPAVGEDLLHWIGIRHGAAAAHARAARLAPVFAPGSDWANAAAKPDAVRQDALRPRWQSRLVEEDAVATRADSLSLALSKPDAAAARMAQRLRAAAVFEHKAAQADTAHAQAGLRRAAALYEQTLELFPGAEDEPSTWLYLGEARYGLAAHESAADAYVKAATHPGADSALAHTAAGAELAALDAATARHPEAVLDRYEKSARGFSERYPRDGRGVDASARIGALAFEAKRWDQADRAYRQVAIRTPDAKRAAGARKLVGDIAWQQEHYEDAAARYDTALTVARAAGADTLAGALGRLVPASWYRAAEVREAKGDRKQAATGFEKLVRRHAEFEYADRALYRAAALRAAERDTAAAANDYEWMLRAYPKSPLHADALLESGRCRESLGESEVAARAFSGFATQYPQHAQARAARLRAGLLYANGGRPAAADSQYAAVLHEIHPDGTPPRDAALAADLWMRRARLAKAPAGAVPHYRRALECGAACPKPDRAEALFQLTEAELPAYQAVTLRQPITESLPRKQKAVEKLLSGYGNSAEQQVEPWHAAACLRIGETLSDLGKSLRTSEPPAELQGEDLFAYQETLNKQAEALDDRAVEAWSRGLAAARDAKHADGWTQATEDKLYPLLAARVPTRPAPLFVLVQP